MYPLNKEEQKLWDFLKDEQNWILPSFQEMCKFMGMTSKGSMYLLVRRLKNKGYLKKSGRYLKLMTEKDKIKASK